MKNGKIIVLLIALSVLMIFLLDSQRAVNKFTDELGIQRKNDNAMHIASLDGYKKEEKKIVDDIKGDPERFSQAEIQGGVEDGSNGKLENSENQRDSETQPGTEEGPLDLNTSTSPEETAQEIINTAGNTDTQVLAESTKVVPPIRVLIIGDSLVATGFGPRLEADLKAYKGVKVYREGRYSTGLNRTDYYNWYKRLDQLEKQFNPNVIVIFFGANDGQTIKDSKGKACKLYASCWEGIYSQRVYDYMKKASGYANQVYWIGHPIPKTNDFYKKFTVMNRVYGNQSKKFSNVTFVNMWGRFAVNGKYSAYVKDNTGKRCSAKNGDGVHLSICGAKIASDYVIPYMKKNVALSR